MCIAIYKPVGVAIPNKKILQTCFKNNPDGAGYLVIKDKKVYGYKGFMNFKEFWDSFRKQNYTKKDELAFHFRIGTSGELTESFTHPFPITDKVQELKALSFITNKAVLHNGVIGVGTKQLSDTMLFIKDVLFNFSDLFDNKKVIKAIENMTVGNRLLIVDNGKVYKTGTWIKDKGVFYSNDTYKKEKYTWFLKDKDYDTSPVKYGNNNYNRFEETELYDICPVCGSSFSDIDYDENSKTWTCYACQTTFDNDFNEILI